jgi:hypothetical protein
MFITTYLNSVHYTFAPYYLPSADFIPNRYPHLGSNILVISINVIFVVNIVNNRHIGSMIFIIFITIIIRCHTQVCNVAEVSLYATASCLISSSF